MRTFRVRLITLGFRQGADESRRGPGGTVPPPDDGGDTTERVYHRQRRPVRRSAAKAMDDILNDVG
ncbi:hypothetical protein [Nocardiopsis quinghaiensis]|uniref:hypothetical protein n=1 Tax=Nocardiopsis quinghaiensis TaxID=464995 RepID=UPI0012393761|nr:hypothetical protein [Nocardiopsis quinghaiensis]